MANQNFGHDVAMHLRGAYLTMHRAANLRFQNSFNVTADQYVILNILAANEGISQQVIKDRCYSDPNTIGAIIRLLEKKRLVVRIRNKTDRRAWQVCLTPKGRRIQKKVWEFSKTIHRQLQQLFRNETERKTVNRILDRVIQEFKNNKDKKP